LSFEREGKGVRRKLVKKGGAKHIRIRNHELARKQREEEEGAEIEGLCEECLLMDPDPHPHPHPHLHSLPLLSPFIFPFLSLSSSSFPTFSTHFIQIAASDP